MTDPELTSTANPTIRAAAALRERRARDSTGLTLVDGGRELLRALERGIAVDRAFVCEPLLATVDAREAVARLRAAGARIHTTSEAAFAKVAFGDRAEGVVAVVRPPSTALDDLRLPAAPLVVVLEAVEKPGNLGAVLRSADGAGADALIVADPLADPWNPNVIRASVGTAFTIPIAVAPGPDVRAWLEARGIRVITAVVGAPTTYWDADLTGPLAIVVGSEHEGLRGPWHDPRMTAVSLPMLGAADSLNVSVSAAVLLYEARRQRGTP